MFKNINKRNDGFTIVEVMIVLAIIGMMLLAVLLVVPALQRSARNSSRRGDVNTLLTAYTEYTNNAGGTIPASCAGTATTCFVTTIKPAYYGVTSSSVSFTAATSATARAAVTSAEEVRIYNYAKCNPATGAAVATNATRRAIVALFAVETSNGTQAQCIES